jgi:hypothetical protein
VHRANEKCLHIMTWKGKDRSEGKGVEEDNIKLYPRKIRWEGVERIHLTQNCDRGCLL